MIEERVVGLEAFLHGTLALLGTYASLDPRYGRGRAVGDACYDEGIRALFAK